MAYTPTEWVTGDVITAVKLNKAEAGIQAANAIAGAVMIPISWEGNVATLAASYNDIVDHKDSVVIAVEDLVDDDGSVTYYYLTVCYVESDTYYATFIGCEGGASTLTVLQFAAAADDAPLTFTFG